MGICIVSHIDILLLRWKFERRMQNRMSKGKKYDDVKINTDLWENKSASANPHIVL